MIRKLMASSAVLALMTAGTWGVAQAQTQTEPAETQPPAAIEEPAAGAATEDAAATDADASAADQTQAADAESTLQPEEPTIATAFIGQSVFSSEDPESDNIGEVKDLVISEDGTITEAVIGVGGFLGIGEKEVAVPFDELDVFERDGEIRLVYVSTREQLEAAEEFDRTAYDPWGRFSEEQQAAVDTGAGGVVTPQAGAPIAPMAPESPDAAATAGAGDAVRTDEESEAAGKTEAFGTDEGVVTAEGETPTAPDQQAAAGTEEDPAAGEQPAEQDLAAADTDAAVPADQEMAADTDAAEPMEETMAQTDAASGQEPAMSAEPAFISFSADQVRASTLMGKEVFGPDDESIGEVSDLVLQQDGETRAALIDVGGFLGVGEKEVAIPFEQIEVTQPAEEGGEPRLTVAMSRDELEQLPAFEDQTMGAEQDMAATDQPAAEDPAAEPAPIEPAEDMAADTDAAQPDQEMTADTQTDATQPDQEVAAAEQPPADVVAGSADIGPQDLSAEDLLGAAVYGSNDENLGEVGDVIFDQGGGIEAVVVDVGGFLGIGEKPVAVQFDSLNVQKEENGDTTLWLNATQEQLENAPSYQEEAAAQ